VTDQSLFNNDPQVTPETTASPSSLFNDQLAAIKNESGEQKYKTLDDALNALKHSQEYIPDLKTQLDSTKLELEALKVKLGATETVESAIQKLASEKSETNLDTTNVSGLDEQGVINLLNKLEAGKSTATNVSQVDNAISKKYGEKAKEIVANKARELGITPERMGQLAGENPNLVLALFGATASPTNSTTTSSYNIPANAPIQPNAISPPEKSLLSGATTAEQVDYMRKVREEVYRKHGIQS